MLSVQVRERERERKLIVGRGPVDCPWPGEWCVMVGWSPLHYYYSPPHRETYSVTHPTVYRVTVTSAEVIFSDN